MACPGLAIGADASLASSLVSIDCQVNGAVAMGYGRLFGPGGGLGTALTLALTIYVAVLALGLITGRTRLTLGTLTPRALTLGLVLTFATAWPAYQAAVYGLLTGGPDQVASAFLGARSGAAYAFAARLDVLFDALLQVGQAVGAIGKAPNLAIASGLIWASALILLIATLGLLVAARVVLAVLLALGPVFIVFALFGGTRGLFEGWLRTAVAFALAPMLIVLGGSGVMSVLGPLIGVIGDDPAGAVAELRPIVTLFIASVVYAGLVCALAWAAVSLTRGWRLRFGDPAATAPDAAPDARAGAAAALSMTPAAAPASPAHPHAERVSTVVSAMLREGARDARRIDGVVQARAAVGSPALAPRRAEGLGQTFRAPPAHRALSGPVGS